MFTVIGRYLIEYNKDDHHLTICNTLGYVSMEFHGFLWCLCFFHSEIRIERERMYVQKMLIFFLYFAYYEHSTDF